MLTYIAATLLILWVMHRSASKSLPITVVNETNQIDNVTYALLVRSYHGGSRLLNQYLLSTIPLFVDSNKFPLTVILDEESPKDHELGHCLKSLTLPISVEYEKLPGGRTNIESVDIFPTTAWPGQRYGTKGYMRQLWSTYYFDLYTDAEIIGIVDSDSSFFSYVTKSTILDPVGRIHARALYGIYYRNDVTALGFNDIYEFMGPARFPMWFYRETFANCRRHIATRFNTTFDEAFKIFAAGPSSPFNVLYSYAVKHEPERYRLVLTDDPTGTISVATHQWIGKYVLFGCCHSYGVSCTEELLKDYSAVLKYGATVASVTWLNNTRLAIGYYDEVKRELDKLPESQRTNMARECKDFLSGKRQVKCIQ